MTKATENQPEQPGKPAISGVPLDSLPDILCVADISLVMRLSGQTVRQMLASGELPGCKVGRRWYVSKTRLLDRLAG